MGTMPKNLEEFRLSINDIYNSILKEMRTIIEEIRNKEQQIDEYSREINKLNKILEKKIKYGTTDFQRLEIYKKWVEQQGLKNKRKEVIQLIKRVHPDVDHGKDNSYIRILTNQLENLKNQINKNEKQLKGISFTKSEQNQFNIIMNLSTSDINTIMQLNDEEAHNSITYFQKRIKSLQEIIEKKRKELNELNNKLEGLKIWMDLLGDGYKVEIDDATSYIVRINTMTFISLDEKNYYMIGYYFPSTELGKHTLRSVIYLIGKETVLDVIKEDLSEWQKKQIKPDPNNSDTPR